MSTKRIEITKSGKSYAARIDCGRASVALSICSTDSNAARGIAYRIAAEICESGATGGMRACVYVEAQEPIIVIETLRGTSGEMDAAIEILKAAANAVSE